MNLGIDQTNSGGSSPLGAIVFLALGVIFGVVGFLQTFNVRGFRDSLVARSMGPESQVRESRYRGAFRLAGIIGSTFLVGGLVLIVLGMVVLVSALMR